MEFSTRKNTQPYWLLNRLVKCLLYNCLLLAFIFIFLHLYKNRSVFRLVKISSPYWLANRLSCPSSWAAIMLPKFISCNNAIMVVTGRAHCSIVCIYIYTGFIYISGWIFGKVIDSYKPSVPSTPPPPPPPKLCSPKLL